MFSAIKSLSWEVLQKNKTSLLVTTLLVPIIWFSIKTYMMSMTAYADFHYGKIENMILLQATLFLCVVLSYMEPTGRSMTAGFPQHILRLPLPTWFIAMVPIILGSIVITLFVLSWLLLISDYDLALSKIIFIWAAITAMMTWIQAIIWGFIKTVVQKSMLLVGILIVITILLQSVIIEQVELSLLGRFWGVISLTGFLVMGYWVAFLAVSRSRLSKSGFSLPIAEFFQFLISKIGINPKIPTFNSPKQAQDWYEWKQRGWLMPAMLIMVSVVLLFVTVKNPPNVEAVLIFYSVGLVYMTAFTGGEYATSKVGSGTTDIISFTATRPLSVYELALSKLRLVGKSLSYIILINIVTILLSIYLIEELKILPKIMQMLVESQGITGAWTIIILYFIFEFSLIWAIAGLTASLALTANKKAQWLLTYITIAGIIFLVTIVQEAYESPEFLQPLIQNAHLIIIIPSILIIGFSLMLLIKFKTLESLRPLRLPAQVVAISVSLCLLAIFQLEFSLLIQWALSWLFINVGLLCFLPFIGAPLAVSINRSR